MNLLFCVCIYNNFLSVQSILHLCHNNLLDLIDTIKQMYQNPNKDDFDTIGILIQKF